MATSKKSPAKKVMALPYEQWWAYERLSTHIFLTAANMLRNEKVLLTLVGKKLARMTRGDGVLAFMRAEHPWRVTCRDTLPEPTPGGAPQLAKAAGAKSSVVKIAASAPTATTATTPEINHASISLAVARAVASFERGER